MVRSASTRVNPAAEPAGFSPAAVSIISGLRPFVLRLLILGDARGAAPRVRSHVAHGKRLVHLGDALRAAGAIKNLSRRGSLP